MATDKIGALALPIPVPVDDNDPVSDPFLKYALSFFQAVINFYAGDAWAAVAKGVEGPVHKTRAFDPVDMSFQVNDLPCLYMWREEGGHTDRMAEDILAYQTKVHALWVLPPVGDEAKQKRRVQLINGVFKILTRAYELGRDPAWVVPGDPDPQAATYGSVFPRWAGVSAITSPRWKRKIFLVTNHDAREVYRFQAFEAVLDLEEILEEDDTKFAPNQKIDVTETTEDGLVVTDHATFT